MMQPPQVGLGTVTRAAQGINDNRHTYREAGVGAGGGGAISTRLEWHQLTPNNNLEPQCFY